MLRTLLRLAASGIADLRLHPWAQLFTLTAVTLAAFLAGLLLLLLANLERELVATHGQVQVQLYWAADAPMDQVQKDWKAVERIPEVSSLRTYTPAQAAEELADSLGGGESLGLDTNPPALPPTALVTITLPPEAFASSPSSSSSDQAAVPDRLETILAQLQALPGSPELHANPVQVGTARSWLTVSQRFLWPLVAILAIVAGLIVGNTIKLAQVSRLDEVEILRLVGAKQWYIQLPMLIAGAVQGAAGGLLGLALLKAFQLGVRDLLNTPPLLLTIEFLPAIQAAGLVALLTVVGVVASWVAVER